MTAARWLAVLLGVIGLAVAASTARADPWFADEAPAPDAVDRYLAGTPAPDAVDRYLGNERTPAGTPVATPGPGFTLDWPTIAIAVGSALAAVLLVGLAVSVGRHGGPGRPVPHG